MIINIIMIRLIISVQKKKDDGDNVFVYVYAYVCVYMCACICVCVCVHANFYEYRKNVVLQKKALYDVKGLGKKIREEKLEKEKRWASKRTRRKLK